METNKPAVIFISAIMITQFIFFALKTYDIISWRWLWIFSPLWIPYILLMIASVILVIYLSICNMKKHFSKKE